MIILIDGYNVLRGVLEGREASEQMRNQFLIQLGRYVRRKKHSIIVIFDGGSNHLPEKMDQYGVHVVYSGYVESADDLIKKKLITLYGKDALLVSSDRELNDWAAKYDVPSIDAQDFYDLLQGALAAQSDGGQFAMEEIHISDEAQDLDTLMEEATRVVPVKQQDLMRKVERRVSPSYKQSKINRRLIEILKKL